MKTVRDVSAGGVVLRRLDSRLEVALVGKLTPRRWGLPKGTPNEDESLEQTALREVQEETGLQVRLIQSVGEIDYWFRWGGVRHYKTVHFYLMEAVGGDVSLHDHEYDVVRWFTLNEARREMTYPSEIEMVERAQDLIHSNGTDPRLSTS